MTNLATSEGVRLEKRGAAALLSTLLLFASLTASSVSFAEGEAGANDRADKRAAAEQLFLDGKELMSKGRYAEACPKLAESQYLDAAVGTLLNLADCLEHLGRTASAWAEFRAAAAAANAKGQAEREAVARMRADKLEPRLTRLVITPSSSGESTPGFQIRKDGETLGKALWGTAVPVDPGPHTIEAMAPGKKPFRVVVEIPEQPGTRTMTTVPELENVPGQTSVNGKIHSSFGTQRTFGAVAAGLGVVSLGLGAILGTSAMSKNNDSNAHCIEGNLCDAEGVALRDQAISRGDGSTAAFVIGAALGATGAILWFTAPSAGSPRVSVGGVGTGAGLSIGGSF